MIWALNWPIFLKIVVKLVATFRISISDMSLIQNGLKSQTKCTLDSLSVHAPLPRFRTPVNAPQYGKIIGVWGSDESIWLKKAQNSTIMISLIPDCVMIKVVVRRLIAERVENHKGQQRTTNHNEVENIPAEKH